MKCPFRMCDASVVTVAERRAPDGDETTTRIPAHALGGHEEFGQCPASLQEMPLSSYALAQLADQDFVIQRILDEREAAKRITSAADKQQGAHGEHPKTPHPTGAGERSGWWTPSRPPLGALPEDGSKTIGGSTVTTVAEIKALINRANELTAEGQELATTAAGKLAESLQLINIVRQTSADPMGAPALLGAIADVESAAAKCHIAIEAATTYRDGML